MKINVFEIKEELYRVVVDFYIKVINEKLNMILGLVMGIILIFLY